MLDRASPPTWSFFWNILASLLFYISHRMSSKTSTTVTTTNHAALAGLELRDPHLQIHVCILDTGIIVVHCHIQHKESSRMFLIVGQRTTLWSQFSPPTCRWSLGIELRFSGFCDKSLYLPSHLTIPKELSKIDKNSTCPLTSARKQGL